MKRITFILGVLFCLASFSIAHAQAWYTCNVIRAGITSYSNTAVAYLTDTASTPAFTNRPFTLSSTTTSQQLATALTALSAGKTVYVYAYPNLTGNVGSIINFYTNQ